MRKIIIIGATSAIAEATARIFAGRGDSLFLVARRPLQLQAIADDLKIRGGNIVATHTMDANDISAHNAMFDAAENALGGLDTLLIAHGTLSDQSACEKSVALTMAEINTNALSVIALLTEAANRFEAQGFGSLAVISSVAGDRGRQSNYVYGGAKAMVSTFAAGLAQRMYKAGVTVTIIKPGFIDTPMTRGFAKKGILWSTPAVVARIIVEGIDKKRTTIYAPAFWRAIMWVIRAIPEGIFNRLTL